MLIISWAAKKEFRSPLRNTLNEGCGRINAPHGTELCIINSRA